MDPRFSANDQYVRQSTISCLWHRVSGHPTGGAQNARPEVSFLVARAENHPFSRKTNEFPVNCRTTDLNRGRNVR